MKIGSLCTGYGGLDLAAEAFFDAETIWCAEFDKYASQVIDQRFGIPNHGDIKTIKWEELPQIDILTAGYPCQPFSHAGERKGTDDPRHIFPYIAKAIGILRPRIVILENVRGHLSLGFKEVLKELAILGYDARWQIVRASDAGAPHQRARLFIIAYPNGSNWRISSSNKKSIIADTNGEGLQRTWNSSGNPANGSISDTDNQCQSHNRQVQELGRRFATRREMCMQTPPNALVDGKLNAEFVEYMMGLPKGWVTNTGLSRSQQLKMLGNGVVPQQAYLALELLTNGNQFS